MAGSGDRKKKKSAGVSYRAPIRLPVEQRRVITLHRRQVRLGTAALSTTPFCLSVTKLNRIRNQSTLMIECRGCSETCTCESGKSVVKRQQ